MPIIQSYLFRGDLAVFVSTIRRTSDTYEGRFSQEETTVFEWDQASRKAGEVILRANGGLSVHFQVCLDFLTGK